MTAPPAERLAPGTLLLYDGSCGFCATNVQFVLRHERRRRTLHFAALEGTIGSRVRAAHPELARVDSLIWYEPPTSTGAGRILVRSDAVLAVASYLGGIWSVLGALGRLVPRTLRDAAYDLVARNRHRVGGRADACLLPTAEQRTRFETG